MRLIFAAGAIVVSLCIASFSISPVAAQDAADAEPARETDPAEEAEHQKLRELRGVFEKAASENNLELLRPHVAEKFSAVTFTNREFTDFDAFKDRWQKTRDEIVGSGSYKVTLVPEKSEIIGDLAIARGDSENILVNSAGKEFRFGSRWTAICRKDDSGAWKIVRAHSSIDPFGNPMLIDGVKSKLLQVGGIAALAGLVLGGLIAYFLARGRAPRASSTSDVSPKG